MIAPNPHHRIVTRRKRVKAVGRRGRVYGVFPSIVDAAAAMGVWRSAIVTALCRGSRCGGYYWRLADVPDREQRPLTPRVRTNEHRKPIPERFLPQAPAPRPPMARPVVSQGRILDHTPSPVVRTARERDGSVPDRTPADWERGRFEKAKAYNPALTWEAWQAAVTGEKRGRRPGWQERKAARGGKPLRERQPVLDSGAIGGRGEM